MTHLKHLPPEPMGPRQSLSLCDAKGKSIALQENDEVSFRFKRGTCEIVFARMGPHGSKKIYFSERGKGGVCHLRERSRIRLEGEKSAGELALLFASLAGLDVASFIRMFGGKILVYKFLARR